MQCRQWRLIPKTSEACGENAKACDEMREEPPGIAVFFAIAELQFLSMQLRILRSTLITDYNLFHGNLILPLGGFFAAPAVNNLRGHQFNVRQPRFQLA